MLRGPATSYAGPSDGGEASRCLNASASARLEHGRHRRRLIDKHLDHGAALVDRAAAPPPTAERARFSSSAAVESDARSSARMPRALRRRAARARPRARGVGDLGQRGRDQQRGGAQRSRQGGQVDILVGDARQLSGEPLGRHARPRRGRPPAA